MAIHDLSGFGNTSLMAVIPIMYRKGISVCALPTAFLSANTCFPDYKMQDTTAFMRDCITHWKAMDLRFDAIYSGFLGSAAQSEIVIEAIDSFKTEATLVLVDPVLADDGLLYSCYDESMIAAMQKLISRADIITPNFTEACLLSGVSWKNSVSEIELKHICIQLARLGAGNIIITSVPSTNPQHSNVLLYEVEKQELSVFECNFIPCFYPGTGDIFASVLLAELMNDMDLQTAIQIGVDFVYQAITQSLDYTRNVGEGLLLEKALPMLDAINSVTNCKLRSGQN